MSAEEGQRAGETMKFGEWEPVLRDDPRGQPVPYYRGLVCLVAHGENIISVVTKDGSSIPSECWDDVAKLVASAPTLTTENARLTERVKVLEAALTAIEHNAEKWLASHESLEDRLLPAIWEDIREEIDQHRLFAARTTLTHGEGK